MKDKVRKPTSPENKIKPIFFFNYKNACGSSFGPNLGLHYEPWPMGFSLGLIQKEGYQ
jgi:hypothetical protein